MPSGLPKLTLGRNGVSQISEEARLMLRSDPDNQGSWLKGLKVGRGKREVGEGQKKLLSFWPDWELTHPWFPSSPRREKEAAVWDHGIWLDFSWDAVSFVRSSLAPEDWVGIG